MSYTQEQFHDFIEQHYDEIRCPSCGSDNWKGAVHSKPDFSIHCYDCNREDTGSFAEHETILKPWEVVNA